MPFDKAQDKPFDPAASKVLHLRQIMRESGAVEKPFNGREPACRQAGFANNANPGAPGLPGHTNDTTQKGQPMTHDL